MVHHPKEVLRKGDEVQVKVLEVSRENHRIGLGLKQATEDPWDDIISHFEVGKIVEGKIFRILEKGVIVELEMDVEGIISSDTFSSEIKKKIMDGLKQHQQIQCEVLEVRPEDKKVLLSLAEGFIPSEIPAEEVAPEPEEAISLDEPEVDQQQSEEIETESTEAEEHEPSSDEETVSEQTEE